MECEEDKVKHAAKIKEDGNGFYKSEKYEDARSCYKQVLDLLARETSLTGEEKEKRDKLVLTAHLNLAACELKLENPAKVIEHCNQVIQTDKNNFKACARRAQAYHKIRDYNAAKNDIEQAKRLQPQNEEITKLEEKIVEDLTATLTSHLERPGAGSASNTQQAGATRGKDCPENEKDQDGTSDIYLQPNLNSEFSRTMENAEDKVKRAAKIKEEGNVFYKSGKCKKARGCYHDVLDLLAIETSLTGEEKAKRDKLVLTAHLNLAACELKMEKYTRAIRHCSQVLEMDKDNVKAYFRRAQACYEIGEYGLVIEDMRKASQLQPQNEEVIKLLLKWAKQISVLAKVHSILKQHRAGSANNAQESGATGGKDCPETEDDQEYHDLEEIDEGGVEEATLGDKKACPKMERHSEYIPVNDFSRANLPAPYNTPEMEAMVKVQVASTVRLRVCRNGKDRPEYFPGTKIKYPLSGTSGNHSGTGVVLGVVIHPESGNKECPCTDCEQSRTPKTEFAQIKIQTATHVICSLEEGKKSVCYFNFDTDQTDLASCLKLNRAVEVQPDVDSDLCHVTFVTHDIEWAIRLDNTSLSDKMVSIICAAIGIVGSGGTDEKLPLKHKFDQLYKRCEEMMMRSAKCMEAYRDLSRERIIERLEDHMSEHPEKLPLEYLLFLLHCFTHRSDIEGNQRSSWDCFKVLSKQLEQIRSFKEKCTGNTAELDSQHDVSVYQRVNATLYVSDRVIRLLERKLNMSSVDEIGAEQKETDVWNACHLLTIIVSHPHGLSKKISIGETTERILLHKGVCKAYKYNNVTCSGSSGAPVLILGMENNLITFPHSKMVHFLSSQSGESAVF